MHLYMESQVRAMGSRLLGDTSTFEAACCGLPTPLPAVSCRYAAPQQGPAPPLAAACGGTPRCTLWLAKLPGCSSELPYFPTSSPTCASRLPCAGGPPGARQARRGRGPAAAPAGQAGQAAGGQAEGKDARSACAWPRGRTKGRSRCFVHCSCRCEHLRVASWPNFTSSAACMVGSPRASQQGCRAQALPSSAKASP